MKGTLLCLPCFSFWIPLILFLCCRWRGPSRQSSQRHAGNGHRGGQGGNRGGNAAWNSSAPVQDQHVPVRGFNAAEAKNILKKGMACRALKRMKLDSADPLSPGPGGTISDSLCASIHMRPSHIPSQRKHSSTGQPAKITSDPEVLGVRNVRPRVLPPCFTLNRSDEHSKHNGERQGLLRRAPEASRFIATERPSCRRLVQSMPMYFLCFEYLYCTVCRWIGSFARARAAHQIPYCEGFMDVGEGPRIAQGWLKAIGLIHCIGVFVNLAGLHLLHYSA